MFKSVPRPFTSAPQKVNKTFLSPVCRRRLKRCKESMSMLSLSQSSKSLDRIPKEERQYPAWTRCWWSSPQLRTKGIDPRTVHQSGRRTSSEWTKIKHSLDFIRRSKEIIKQKKSCLNPKKYEETEHSRSLFFIGQVYPDIFEENYSS